ncbi:MAG: restriction endonuclease subunit S [Bacillota bacterium]
MTPQELRNSILQLAIQGKLVEQKEKESTGEELYKKIQKEKARLIKEKKIKREKPLPKVSEDEIPFDIPENWKWVRLGEVGEVVGGGTPKTNVPEYWDKNGIPWLTPADMKFIKGKYARKGQRSISKMGLEKSSARLMPRGSILYSSRAPIGYIAIAENSISTNQGFKSLVPIVNETNEYLYYFLMANTKEIINRASGTTFKEVSGKEFGMTVVPLPPLAEQKRIVTKIEEILPYIDQYEKSWSELEELNKKFPEDLQKSILQEAIQGKLVGQKVGEGTGEELYKEIQKEKGRLLKERKIKREKPLPEITTDEIPFDIPENWKWVRLGDIFQINPRNNIGDDTKVSFIPMALLEGGYQSRFSYEIKLWKDVKKGYTHFIEDDIVMAKITPCFQNLKSAIMRNLENGTGAGTTEFHVFRNYYDVCLEYVLWFVKSPVFIYDCISKMTGTAGQQRVGTNIVKNYLFPLPPLAEQKRIVAKIEKLLPLCDKLKQ